jgi:hypothetical protein
MKKIIMLLFLLAMVVPTVIGADQQETKIADLKKQIVLLQNKGELGFKDFTLCTSIVSFASYVPAQTNTVKSGSEIYFYYEPKNVFTNIKDGLYEIWFTQDMIVLSEKGEVLLEKKDALSFHYTTKSPVLDLYATNTLTLTDVEPGKYTFKAVLKDLLKKKEITQTYAFEVVK